MKMHCTIVYCRALTPKQWVRVVDISFYMGWPLIFILFWIIIAISKHSKKNIPQKAKITMISLSHFSDKSKEIRDIPWIRKTKVYEVAKTADLQAHNAE